MGWFRTMGKERPWLQGCIIAASGLLLSAGTCFGYLATMNFNSGNSSLGEGFTFVMIALSLLFALAIPVGGIWFLVGLVKSLSKPPAPPPPPPPAA
ncbi:MAG: hypothetical protein AB7G12_14095 [Thermoanaerobaculia bacterium]